MERRKTVTSDNTYDGKEISRNIKKEKSESNSILKSIVKNRHLLAIFIRLLSVLLNRTYFVADEYWQSTEVAHRNVFKYGYITWEWKYQIRSYLYPFMFEMYFRILEVLGLDSSIIVIYGPHFIQAVLTAFSDLCLYEVTLKYFQNEKIAVYSYLFNLLSWFIFYTGSRTLSGTASMCFVSYALYFYPFGKIKEASRDNNHNKTQRKLKLSLIFISVSCIIRPTSLIVWGTFLLISFYQKPVSIANVFLACVNILPIVTVLLFGIDYYFYKQLVFTHWNFLRINVYENVASSYGSHTWHWYLSQGLTVTLSLHLVLIFLGFYYCGNKSMGYVAIVYVFILSLISHKEFRFLLPIFPLIMPYSGYGFMKLCTKLKDKRKYSSSFLTVLAGLNIIFALYFCTIHQRGVIDVMFFISGLVETGKNPSVLFLMPCHSTPFYSYIHQNISMRFLTCHPNDEMGYIEEADLFFSNPVKWLSTESHDVNKYSNIILYSTLDQNAQQYLLNNGFAKVASFFHTHFPEGRIGIYVDIYERIT